MAVAAVLVVFERLWVVSSSLTFLFLVVQFVLLRGPSTNALAFRCRVLFDAGRLIAGLGWRFCICASLEEVAGTELDCCC